VKIRAIASLEKKGQMGRDHWQGRKASTAQGKRGFGKVDRGHEGILWRVLARTGGTQLN